MRPPIRWKARPFQQDLLREAAGGLRQIAEAVEGKSIGTLAGDLTELSRQNPIAFLGGAALVGFALARFARASTPVGTPAASRFGAGSADRSGDQIRSGTDLGSADFAGESDHG